MPFSKERTTVIIFGILISIIFLKEYIDTHHNTDGIINDGRQKKIDSTVKKQEKNMADKMIMACKDGLIKGCIAGGVSGGFVGAIAGGTTYGIANPIITYITEHGKNT